MDDEERHVCAAQIAASPWPEHAGEPCDGHSPGSATATWAVWTSVDTGDGFRLACDECLGDWVISVGSRLW